MRISVRWILLGVFLAINNLFSDVTIYKYYFVFSFLVFYFTAFLFFEALKQKDRNLATSAYLSLSSLFVFNAGLALLK